jgi:hypothetical protein
MGIKVNETAITAYFNYCTTEICMIYQQTKQSNLNLFRAVSGAQQIKLALSICARNRGSAELSITR